LVPTGRLQRSSAGTGKIIAHDRSAATTFPKHGSGGSNVTGLEVPDEIEWVRDLKMQQINNMPGKSND
jgi:hypothetical protein